MKSLAKLLLILWVLSSTTDLGAWGQIGFIVLRQTPFRVDVNGQTTLKCEYAATVDYCMWLHRRVIVQPEAFGFIFSDGKTGLDTADCSLTHNNVYDTKYDHSQLRCVGIQKLAVEQTSIGGSVTLRCLANSKTKCVWKRNGLLTNQYTLAGNDCTIHLNSIQNKDLGFWECTDGQEQPDIFAVHYLTVNDATISTTTPSQTATATLLSETATMPSSTMSDTDEDESPSLIGYLSYILIVTCCILFLFVFIQMFIIVYILRRRKPKLNNVALAMNTRVKRENTYSNRKVLAEPTGQAVNFQNNKENVYTFSNVQRPPFQRSTAATLQPASESEGYLIPRQPNSTDESVYEQIDL